MYCPPPGNRTCARELAGRSAELWTRTKACTSSWTPSTIPKHTITRSWWAPNQTDEGPLLGPVHMFWSRPRVACPRHDSENMNGGLPASSEGTTVADRVLSGDNKNFWAALCRIRTRVRPHARGDRNTYLPASAVTAIVVRVTIFRAHLDL